MPRRPRHRQQLDFQIHIDPSCMNDLMDESSQTGHRFQDHNDIEEHNQSHMSPRPSQEASPTNSGSRHSDKRATVSDEEDAEVAEETSFVSHSEDNNHMAADEVGSSGSRGSHHEHEDDVFSDNSPRSSMGSMPETENTKQNSTPHVAQSHSPRISDIHQYDYDDDFIPTVRGTPRPVFRSPSSVKAMQMSSPPASVLGTPRSARRSGMPSVSRLGSPSVSAQYSPKKTPPRFKRNTPPLVLLHVTLLPLRWAWGDVLEFAKTSDLSDDTKLLREAWRQLHDRNGDTVQDRGVLLPHPQNDFEVLEERVLEALELPLRRRARILECGHYLGPANEMAFSEETESEDEDFYDERRSSALSSDKETHWCKTCCSEIKYDSLGQGKIYRVKIYASNGLLRPGSWEACWKEMERVDVELEPIIEPRVQEELNTLMAAQEKALEERERALDEQERVRDEQERALEEHERALEEQERALEEKERVLEEQERAWDEQKRAREDEDDEDERVMDDEDARAREMEEAKELYEEQQGEEEEEEEEIAFDHHDNVEHHEEEEEEEAREDTPEDKHEEEHIYHDETVLDEEPTAEEEPMVPDESFTQDNLRQSEHRPSPSSEPHAESEMPYEDEQKQDEERLREIYGESRPASTIPRASDFMHRRESQAHSRPASTVPRSSDYMHQQTPSVHSRRGSTAPRTSDYMHQESPRGHSQRNSTAARSSPRTSDYTRRQSTSSRSARFSEQPQQQQQQPQQPQPQPYKSATLPELMVEAVKVLMQDKKNVMIGLLVLIAAILALRGDSQEHRNPAFQTVIKAPDVPTVVVAPPQIVETLEAAKEMPTTVTHIRYTPATPVSMQTMDPCVVDPHTVVSEKVMWVTQTETVTQTEIASFTQSEQIPVETDDTVVDGKVLDGMVDMEVDETTAQEAEVVHNNEDVQEVEEVPDVEVVEDVSHAENVQDIKGVPDVLDAQVVPDIEDILDTQIVVEDAEEKMEL